MAEGKGMGYRSIYLDLDAYGIAQGREPDDGAGSMSSWHRIWVDVRAYAPKGLLRQLIRQAEDEKVRPWRIVVRALRRELADPQPTVEPDHGEAPASEEDGGSESGDG